MCNLDIDHSIQATHFFFIKLYLTLITTSYFQTCETRVEKDKTEITKKCAKEKSCKASCDPKDKFCVTCCKGSLCNENEGRVCDRDPDNITPLLKKNLNPSKFIFL